MVFGFVDIGLVRGQEKNLAKVSTICSSFFVRTLSCTDWRYKPYDSIIKLAAQPHTSHAPCSAPLSNGVLFIARQAILRLCREIHARGRTS